MAEKKPTPKKEVSVTGAISFTEQEIMLIRQFLSFINSKREPRTIPLEKQLIALNVGKDINKFMTKFVEKNEE